MAVWPTLSVWTTTRTQTGFGLLGLHPRVELAFDPAETVTNTTDGPRSGRRALTGTQGGSNLSRPTPRFPSALDREPARRKAGPRRRTYAQSPRHRCFRTPPRTTPPRPPCSLPERPCCPPRRPSPRCRPTRLRLTRTRPPTPQRRDLRRRLRWGPSASCSPQPATSSPADAHQSLRRTGPTLPR